MFIRPLLNLLRTLFLMQIFVSNASAGTQVETYCAVPVINQPIEDWAMDRDFFYVYPFPPYVLINGRFGFLWTIKNFNEAVSLEPIQFSYFYNSVYFEQTQSILIYDESSKTKAIRLKDEEFVDFELPRDVENMKYLKKLHLSQIRKNETQVVLGDKLRLVGLNTGVYLHYSPNRIIPILGNQLIDPRIGTKFYQMQGRGDILARAKNGFFIITKNSKKTASYCSLVTSNKSEKYGLKIVRDVKLSDEVKRVSDTNWSQKIVIAEKDGKHKTISLGRRNKDDKVLNLGDVALIEDRHKGRLIRWTLKGRDQIVFPGVNANSQVRHLHRLNVSKKDVLVFLNTSEKPFLLDEEENLTIYKQFPWGFVSAPDNFFSDDDYLYFIVDEMIFKWSERSGSERVAQFDRKKLGRIHQFLRLAKQVVLATDNGIFAIQGDKITPHFLADPYRTGRIHSVRVNSKNTAYLVSANFGLFIIESDGMISQLQSPHGIDVNLRGEIVEVGDQMFVLHGNSVYLVEEATRNN